MSLKRYHKDEDNYIENPGSGERIRMHSNEKGSFMLHVNFVDGGKTKIVVDSSVEEKVCPWEWGEHFGTDPLKWERQRERQRGWQRGEQRGAQRDKQRGGQRERQRTDIGDYWRMIL